MDLATFYNMWSLKQPKLTPLGMQKFLSQNSGPSSPSTSIGVLVVLTTYLLR